MEVAAGRSIAAFADPAGDVVGLLKGMWLASEE
jgi:hypothetical protein